MNSRAAEVASALATASGPGSVASESFGMWTVLVPVGDWRATLISARDTHGLRFFDWLSAVDEGGAAGRSQDVAGGGEGGAAGRSQDVAGGGEGGAAGRSQDVAGRGEGEQGYLVVTHLLDPDTMTHLLISTRVPLDRPSLDSAVEVFRGAAWHERETHEMFGIDFAGHPGLTPLLLPDGFEGHPLRKEFVLASRVAKTWPGAKEPGEGHGTGPRRKAIRPPGVPDPELWGPDAIQDRGQP